MATCKLTKSERKELDELANAADNALCVLRHRIAELADQWGEDWNEKSEKWQESDAGQEAQERIDILQNYCDEWPENIVIDLDALA